MVEVVVTVLTLVLLANGYGRVRRLAEARREEAERELLAAHAEWAAAHGGTTVHPGEVDVQRPWLEVLVEVRGEIDGHQVRVRSGRDEIGGEADEDSTPCRSRASRTWWSTSAIAGWSTRSPPSTPSARTRRSRRGPGPLGARLPPRPRRLAHGLRDPRPLTPAWAYHGHTVSRTDR